MKNGRACRAMVGKEKTAGSVVSSDAGRSLKVWVSELDSQPLDDSATDEVLIDDLI